MKLANLTLTQKLKKTPEEPTNTKTIDDADEARALDIDPKADVDAQG